MRGSSRIHSSQLGIPGVLARFSLLGLLVAFAAGLAQLAAGPGRQFGYWDHNFGFKLLEWGGYGGLVAVGAGLIGMFFAWGVGRRHLVTLGIVSALLGAALAYWPWSLNRSFRAAPALFDISTDTANPPPFVAGLGLRQGARLPSDYPANFATQQQEAYPDIGPMILRNEPPDVAFPRALRAARAMGWTVHAAVPAEGRIEAVAKTLWFGFEDDVVIRVSALDGGSRIDIRSAGRLNRRDGGTNANRVREFMWKLRSTG